MDNAPPAAGRWQRRPAGDPLPLGVLTDRLSTLALVAQRAQRHDDVEALLSALKMASGAAGRGSAAMGRPTRRRPRGKRRGKRAAADEATSGTVQGAEPEASAGADAERVMQPAPCKISSADPPLPPEPLRPTPGSDAVDDRGQCEVPASSEAAASGACPPATPLVTRSPPGRGRSPSGSDSGDCSGDAQPPAKLVALGMPEHVTPPGDVLPMDESGGPCCNPPRGEQQRQRQRRQQRQLAVLALGAFYDWSCGLSGGLPPTEWEKTWGARGAAMLTALQQRAGGSPWPWPLCPV